MFSGDGGGTCGDGDSMVGGGNSEKKAEYETNLFLYSVSIADAKRVFRLITSHGLLEILSAQLKSTISKAIDRRRENACAKVSSRK